MIPTILSIIPTISSFGWFFAALGGFLFAVAIIIFFQDTAKRRGKYFLLLSVAIFAYGIALTILGAAPDSFSFYGALAALFSIVGLIPLILFLFFYIFPKKVEQSSLKKTLAIFLPPIIILVAMVVPDFIITYGGTFTNAPIHSFLGKGYLLYVGYLVIFLCLTLYVLIRKYQESVGIFKTQTQSIIVSSAVALGIFAVILLVSPRPWSAYAVFLAGYIGLVVWTYSLGFILIKYNFWSIKLISTEFFVCVMLPALLAGMFFINSLSGIVVAGVSVILALFASFYLVGNTKREIAMEDEIMRLSSEVDNLRAREKILEQKKSEFLETASHHLRSPLTAIKGYSSMLLEGSFGELAVPVREAVEKIFESSKRLVTMISDFIDISNIEDESMQFSFARVDMKKLVLKTVESMKDEARHTHVNLDVSVDERRGEDYFVNADLSKLRQVIMNLIDNAIKYTPRGNVSVLLSRTDDGGMLLSVSDTGIGMDEATMSKIFKKFSRAEGANKTYTEGLGLGLFVVKEIVKRHNGKIWAKSKGEGIGSTFYVELSYSAA